MLNLNSNHSEHGVLVPFPKTDGAILMKKNHLVLCTTILFLVSSLAISTAEDISSLKSQDTPQPSDVELGLVLYYPFDEKADKVIDQSGNNNHGQLHGATYNPSGIRGSCLCFRDADTFVSIPKLEHVKKAVTISMWVNLSVLPSQLKGKSGSEMMAIFDAIEDAFVLYEAKPYSGLTFKVTTAKDAVRVTIPEKALTRNKWLHIAGVYDGNQAIVYLNGVKKGSAPIHGSLVEQNPYLSINDNRYSFIGMIDEVVIFNRALSNQDIKELFMFSKKFQKTKNPVQNKMEGKSN